MVYGSGLGFQGHSKEGDLGRVRVATIVPIGNAILTFRVVLHVRVGVPNHILEECIRKLRNPKPSALSKVPGPR